MSLPGDESLLPCIALNGTVAAYQTFVGDTRARSSPNDCFRARPTFVFWVGFGVFWTQTANSAEKRS